MAVFRTITDKKLDEWHKAREDLDSAARNLMVKMMGVERLTKSNTIAVREAIHSPRHWMRTCW